MVKIDIKEFHMSGKPGFLSRACSELFCDETEDVQQLVATAVGWLCRNQYVQLEFLPDLTYRVTRGSGMGLLHSGGESDAGFWIAAARGLLNTSVRKRCSSTHWRKFRDDIFAITSNFSSFQTCFQLAPLSCSTRGLQALDRGRQSEQDHLLGCRCLGGQWLFCDETEKKGCCPLPQCVQCSSPRDMCIFRGPVVLRKALGQFCLHRKEQRPAENVFLARLQVLHVSDNNSESQTVFGSTASTSDQRQNSEEHDLACLGTSPIVQNGSIFQGNKKNV